VVFAALGVVGVASPRANPLPLLVLQFATLVFAGWVAGRLAGHAAAAHGGIAGILLFLLAGIVAIAAGGPPLLELLLFGVVAAVLGSAGGALADLRRPAP